MNAPAFERQRAAAVLSVQLEDELRADQERAGHPGPGDPTLVEQRVARVLEALRQLNIRATFFAEGRLTAEVDRELWPRLVEHGHRVGAQGLSRTPVPRLGPDRFADDARRGREVLEDLCGVPVDLFRAPDFMVDGCDPWFGEGLLKAGYRGDSSKRLHALPDGAAHGGYPLEGSDDAVVEMPLPTLPVGTQRAMVLGSASFRMLPLPTIRMLFEHAERQGFCPQLVLQLADFDPRGPTGYEGEPGLRPRFEHLLRSAGRDGVRAKLEQLTYRWQFGPLRLPVDHPTDAPTL